MKRFLSRFCKDTSGAITVDWVVLCAGVVALSVALVTTINGGTSQLTEDTGAYLSTQDFF